MQPLRKTTRTPLPRDPAVAPLSISPKETKTHVHTKPSMCSQQHDSCGRKAEATPMAASKQKKQNVVTHGLHCHSAMTRSHAPIGATMLIEKPDTKGHTVVISFT